MRRRVVCAAVVAWACAGCHRDSATTQLSSSAIVTTDRAPIPDAEIAKELTRHLGEDPLLRDANLQVAVTNGAATLTGTAVSIPQKERAMHLVETLKGVHSSIDRVLVEPVGRDDGPIERDVTDALRDSGLGKTRPITVSVAAGKVTLQGVADGWLEKRLLAELPESVRGVKTIDDEITLESLASRSDTEVANDVKQRLANDIWLDGSVLDVNVAQGVVSLKGVVGSVAERTRAKDNAWLAGASTVNDDGLVVDWALRDEQRHAIEYRARTEGAVLDAVRDAYRLDPRLKDSAPTVAIKDGVVELTGTVETPLARRAAERYARDTVGVKDVHDLVVVRTGEKPTDAELDRRVRHVLERDMLLPDPTEIYTFTSKGKVVLHGQLKAGFERFDAVADAASTKGVLAVDDELTVARTGPDIKADIEDRIYWDATIERDSIKVVAGPEGVITLTGTLDSWSEIRAAMEDAKLGGASRLVNLLAVRKRTAS